MVKTTKKEVNMPKKKDIRIMAYDRDEFDSGIQEIIDDVRKGSNKKAIKQLNRLKKLLSITPPVIC